MIGIKFNVPPDTEEAEALRREQRLGSLTNASKVGVWFCDLPFDELVWDQHVKEHFWLPADARVTIDTFYERLHPEDRDRTRGAIEESIKEKTRYAIDYRTVAPDGRVKWVRAIGHAHYDISGNPVRFDGVTIDISEQRRAEEAARQQTAQFEALFNGSPLGIYLVNDEFKIQQVNPTAQPAFGGISPLIGRDFSEVAYLLWPADHADELVRRFRHTLESGEPYSAPEQTEADLAAQVGHAHEWQISRIPLPENRHGVVCYFKDTSARLAAEKQVREGRQEAERQRRLYETILSNTPDLAYVFDLNHCFIYINEGLLKMWGKTWDEAIGKTCLELGYEPWHAEMHNREIDQIAATGQPIRGEVPFTGTFGRRIYDYILVPVFDAHGHVEAVAGTTRDVTERKNSELRNTFLVKLDDALRPLADSQAITYTAACLLGEYLQVDRCAYADIEPDEDTMNLTGNYMRSPEIQSIVGRLRFSDFGQQVLQLMRVNEPYVVHDVGSHQPPIADPAAYRAAQIQAVICVPLQKEGRFVAAMAVHMAVPRAWTQDEVELLQTVASRCWESIERARLQRGLRESEEQFRHFVTASSDVVYRMSADWAEMHPLTGQDFLADTSSPTRGWLDSYIHPEDRAFVWEAIQEAIQTKSIFEIEHRVIRMDGSMGWTFSRAIPLLDGQGEIMEWFGAATDVTERRNMEELLRQSRDQIHLISDAVPVLISYIDTECRYRFCNEAYTRWFKVPAEEILGQTMEELLGSAAWDTIQPHAERALSGEAVDYEAYARYPTGGRWIHATYTPHFGKDQQVLGMIATVNDITELKNQQEALRESEERARAASAAKDNFLAQLSHELRTPLTPVLMTAAAMREDAAISQPAREAFGMIERHITLEARLIDDLLDLTRVTRGKLTRRDEVCDVHSLIGQALEIVRDGVREKQIALSVGLAARHRHLHGDPARLQQVFWNLLRNAVNFTPHGGRISVVTRDGGGEDGDNLEPTISIEVSDTGVGFDASHVGNLFEPFFQASGSSSSGLGLGLAIARGIVELHSGAIGARSEGTGCGATFVVTLPVTPSLAGRTKVLEGSHMTEAPEGVAESGLRLLLVEDHEATLKVLSTLLARAGHEVTTASSVAEALHTARMHTFDAVVSDLGLPDGTGIELMEHLRAEFGLTGVALSGYGMEEDLRRSRAAGFAAHLVKPVNFEELRRALRRLSNVG